MNLDTRTDSVARIGTHSTREVGETFSAYSPREIVNSPASEPIFSQEKFLNFYMLFFSLRYVKNDVVKYMNRFQLEKSTILIELVFFAHSLKTCT